MRKAMEWMASLPSVVALFLILQGVRLVFVVLIGLLGWWTPKS